VGKGKEAGRLVFTWRVSGDNAEGTTVALYFREKPDGAWRLIAGELQNSRYAWRVPATVPPKVYLRMEVNDRNGGRLVVADTQDPVLLFHPPEKKH
jgi:hypothetical protein